MRCELSFGGVRRFAKMPMQAIQRGEHDDQPGFGASGLCFRRFGVRRRSSEPSARQRQIHWSRRRAGERAYFERATRGGLGNLGRDRAGREVFLRGGRRGSPSDVHEELADVRQFRGAVASSRQPYSEFTAGARASVGGVALVVLPSWRGTY
jgi:hypothetical protein